MDPKSKAANEVRGGLRLITNNKVEQGEDSPKEKAPQPLRSRFAQQLSAFADDLDKQIDEIMKL